MGRDPSACGLRMTEGKEAGLQNRITKHRTDKQNKHKKNNMKTVIYIKRAIKFLIALIVLYLGAMWLMSRIGATMLTPHEMAMNLFLSRRGVILIVVVLVWTAIYPKVGFVSRRVEADLKYDRERIENAFIRSGYVLLKNDGEQLTFRADNFFKRLRLLFEDEVTVSQYGQWIVINGIRRSVAEIEMRLKTYMQNSRRNEQ